MMKIKLFSQCNENPSNPLLTDLISDFYLYEEMNSKSLTVMILSFRTDMPGQTVQTQIRLLRVYTVCHSVCIFWTHYSVVKPHSSNFRVITTIFWGVRIVR